MTYALLIEEAHPADTSCRFEMATSVVKTAVAGDFPPAYYHSSAEKTPPGGSSPSYPSAPDVSPVPSHGPQYQQSMPYLASTPYPTMVAHPKPNYPGPHSFIALVISVTAVCGLLDILSLVFGIPAIMCALLSSFKDSDGDYPKASKYAMAGFILTIINVTFTLLVGFMVASLVIGHTSAICRSIRQVCSGTDCYYVCNR